MHVRRRIVNAAASALQGLGTTGSRVYAGRSWPLPTSADAYLLVYARQEQSESATMGAAARKLIRQLRLIVDGIDTRSADNDAILDTIAAEVEAALMADPTLGGTAKDLHISQTEMTVTADDNDRRVAHVRLEFSITYLTAANAPETLTN
jgi:hypothetical protein